MTPPLPWPFHPYSLALFKEIPRLENRHMEFDPIRGEIPSPLDPPPGCHFHPRCPVKKDICTREVPGLTEIEPGRFAACHNPHLK